MHQYFLHRKISFESLRKMGYQEHQYSKFFFFPMVIISMRSIS
jgi:hypothetical protein